jgi:hypothetical protein
MSLILRLVKGSALTYAEMDGNLTYLDNKVSGSNGYITLISGSNAVSSSILYQVGNKVIGTGSLDLTGTVSASYFVGDGSGLTNLDVLHFISTGSISASVDVNNKLFAITSQSVDLFKFNTDGSLQIYNPLRGTKITGSLEIINTGNTSAFQFNNDIRQTIFVDSTDSQNQFQLALSGSIFNTSPQVLLSAGNKGLNLNNRLKLLTSNAHELTGSLIATSDITTRGDLNVNGTTVAFNVSPSSKYIAFTDAADAFGNLVTLYLSGSSVVSKPRPYLQLGSKGLNINDKINILSSGVEITGSLVVSGSNTFRNVGPAEFTGSVNINGPLTVSGSTNITGSLTLNGQPVIASNNTSSLTVLSASYAESASYALNSGLLNGSGSNQFATLTSNRFVGNQIITGSLTVTGNSTTLGALSAQSQSFFNAGVTINGTNSTLYNKVAFLELNGESGSRLDFFGRDTTHVISTDINDLNISVSSGSAVFEVFDGDFLIYTSGSVLLGSDVTSSANMAISGSVLVGTSSFTPGANEKLIVDAGNTVSYNLITARANTDNYTQINIQNTSNGPTSSADIVATNDIGTETTHYINMGINSSFHVNNGDGIGYANDAYLYTTGSNLYLLNLTPNKDIYMNVSGNGKIAITGSTQLSGSSVQNGNLTLTGSLLVSGSTTQVGNNTLLGNTSLSGSLIISGSENPSTPSIQIFGDTQHTGVVRFNPIARNIDNSISASYIYVSGSTNDLFFTQNGAGYANTTRLRWLEGNLYTGLLNGGLITTQSSTVYQVSSGSGIIVDLNASYTDNPYPTIRYISWPTLSSSIAPLSASFDQSFVAIQASGSEGQIYIQGTPYSDTQFNTLIPIGNVIHQNRSTINATATYPSVAYGYKQRSSDFIRAFGPLKISGLATTISGSSTGSLVITPGTAYSEGRNYTTDANNPSYVQDAGTNTSKIFRYYQSGSSFVYLTNGGAGFPTIDPSQYSLNGVLTPVPSNNFSIQRVYYFPGGATKGIYVYYGNAIYTTLVDAVANIPYEQFAEAPNTAAGAVLSAYLIVRNNASFQTAGSYRIEQAGLFRNVSGGGGGGTVNATRLLDLTDVDLVTSAPTNGQPLVYNGSLSKWQNLSALSASLNGNADTATTASYATFATTAATASFANTFTVNNVLSVTGSIKVSGSLQSLISINQQSGSTYTLQSTDLNRIIEMNTVSGSTNYVVVPDNAITPLPIGFECTVVQYGEGDTIISAESINVNIRSELNRTTLGLQYAPASLVKRGVNEWYLFGRLK